MGRNKLHYAFGLCLLVIGFLLLFSLVKPFHVGKWKYKTVDPLADIRVLAPDTMLAVLDSIQQDSSFQKADSIAQVVKSNCPPGITCVDDYSPDSTGLKKFFRALNRLKENHAPLRIALYGDSFVEGDVFCGSLRDTLQSLFGGEGVDYVPLTSEVAGFRGTIKHQFENWKTYSLVSKKDTTCNHRTRSCRLQLSSTTRKLGGIQTLASSLPENIQHHKTLLQKSGTRHR